MIQSLTRLAVAMALLGMGAGGAHAETPPVNGNNKSAPASVSHPKEGAKGKQDAPRLYPTSAEETADAILADSLGRLFEQTDAHFHKGEYNHAINLNRIVVQGDPHNVEAYSGSAWLLWSSDRNEEALTALTQGLQANPKTYYMYDELGTHYLLRLKDPAGATPYLEQAVKFRDCPFLTWHNLAHCYEKTNQWDKAVTAWEGAAKYVKDTLAPIRLARARAERDKHKN